MMKLKTVSLLILFPLNFEYFQCNLSVYSYIYVLTIIYNFGPQKTYKMEGFGLPNCSIKVVYIEA